MSKFDFTDRDAAWKSISGKKWVRPIPISGKDGYRLFCDVPLEPDQTEPLTIYHDYTPDGKVLSDKGEPIPGHLDNILDVWTPPFSRRSITESVTAVVEEPIDEPIASAPEELIHEAVVSLQEQLTNTRKSTHGDWMKQSACAHSIKYVIHQGGWENLKPHQREALDMIATKISRILNGNPNEPDHWDDIAGYAHLGKGGHSA